MTHVERHAKADPGRACVIGPDLWVRAEEGGTYLVGLTVAAQERAGPIVHYRGPTVGREYRAGEPAISLESGKWVGHLGLPVEGTVVATNPAAEVDPSLINRDPVGAGWLYRMRPRELGALEARGRPLE